GCSHVLTLGHLLGSTVAWALARDRERFGEQPGRRPGERVLRRGVVVDGAEADGRNILLGLQLTALHYAPAPAMPPPLDRFAGSPRSTWDGTRSGPSSSPNAGAPPPIRMRAGRTAPTSPRAFRESR